MSRLFGWWVRLRRAVNPAAFEQQMADEVREHLKCETAQRVLQGEDPVIARRRARVNFGSVDACLEQARDDRFGAWLDQSARNVRFAIRGLRKAPGFTVVAVATIAIGIGAGTAVFSLVNAILLRSLPVPNPHELRVLHWSATESRMRSYNGDYSETVGDREVRDSVNHPTFMALRERAAGMAEIFGYIPAENIAVVTSHTAIGTDGLVVSDNFFSTLGVRAHLGRLFSGGDDATAQPRVVISHGFWQRHFGGAPSALGSSLQMLGIHHTIIGILPREFPGIRPGATHDFYVTMSEASPFLYVPLAEDWHWCIRMMARLHPGTTNARLEAALSPLFAVAAPDRVTHGRIELVSGAGGLGFHRDLYGKPLTIMLGVTALVMLIACANLAGLSLARGASREHELAVRAALGAARRRLVWQSFSESAVLATFGGALGIILALWGRRALSRLLAGTTDGLHHDLTLDASVLGFSLAAATLTAVLAGLLPAWRAGHVDPLAGLKARGTAGTPRLRLGRALVVVQICVSLSVLAAAGLGLRSLLNLRNLDPGFAHDELVVFGLNPSSAGYDTRGQAAFHQRAQTALAALPGVRNATVMHYAHLDDRRSTGGFRFADDNLPPGENRWTRRQAASDTFFETMGIAIVDGRAIAATDTIDAPKVVVVNETFARQMSPDRNPVGRTFNMWNADWTIVGICADAKMANLKEDIPPTTYFAFAQRFYERFALGEVHYAVRSSLPAAALRRPIEQAIAGVNPHVPVTDFAPQAALLNRNIGQERLLALLCAALAGVALLLCCIGLYGLIAYDITRRHREIAIRLAIGAQRGDIAGPIVRSALRLTALGVLAGIPVVLALTRLLQSQLHDVPAHDPVSLGSVVVILLAVAALAALVPARRASKVDPLVALRNE